jgi:RNA 3'-terminal phosphate cyclase (ATP)
MAVIRHETHWPEASLHIEEIPDAQGPGNIVLIEIESQYATEVFTAFGQRGKRAEAVANEAVTECKQYLDANVPVGTHLADQLLLPLALAGRGSFRTLPLTSHSITHIELIRQFLNLQVAVEPLPDGSLQVGIT